MNREKLYKKSVDTLVQAYFNDELEFGDCKACAVGNLLKDTAEQYSLDNGAWKLKFFTTICERTGDKVQLYDQKAIDLTGGVERSFFSLINKQFKIACDELLSNAPYHWKELAQIEFAFETADKKTEDPMFTGLMAVVDVLDKIHENFDTKITEETKTRFINERTTGGHLVECETA